MGCIAKPIVSLQNSYYLTIQSRKKGSTWATWLIIKGWNLVYHLWTHHNSVLHESQALTSLSGLDPLRRAIKTEHTLGRSSLHQVYNRYFSTTLETLLQRPPDQLKQWFLVIRSGREAIHATTPDTFSTNATLRNWIAPPRPSICSISYLSLSLLLPSRSQLRALLAWIVFTQPTQVNLFCVISTLSDGRVGLIP